VNDLATTTGNGDIMPRSNAGIVGLIPLFYFANANLAYGYKFWKQWYDEKTAQAIQGQLGWKLYFYEQEPEYYSSSTTSESKTSSYSYYTSSSSSSSSDKKQTTKK